MGQTQETSSGLSRRVVHLMAVGCGLTVANIYYCQPLLQPMAETFGVSEAKIGYIPALTQAGYALGLLLFVPLGDLFERRRLLVALLAASVMALVGVALAPSYGLLAATSFSVGLVGIAPQLLVPFAAHLARPSERGRVIGVVMSGLLVGILLARTVSGFVGLYLGWRAIYWLAALLIFGLLLMIRAALPSSAPEVKIPYRRLMASLLHLLRDEPVVRQSCLIGAGTFGAFAAFWSTLAFLLGGPPFGYSSDVVGMFGIIGIVGVAAAPLAGRFGDRYDPRLSLGFGIVMMLLSFAIFWAGAASLFWLIVGVVLLDLGAQVVHVSNQNRLYALHPEARSRLVTLYMGASFIGAGLGSSLAASSWSLWGWPGVCIVCIAMLSLSLSVFLAMHRKPPPPAAQVSQPPDHLTEEEEPQAYTA